MSEATLGVTVGRVSDAGALRQRADVLAVEEPLEIRLRACGDEAPPTSLSVTMRTPGHDAELAAGFLASEGIIRRPSDLVSIAHADPPSNVIDVVLANGSAVDVRRLSRHVYTTSACGVCGTTAIDVLRTVSPYTLDAERPHIGAGVVSRLPAALRAAQSLFDETGGLHAAALFDTVGRLQSIREDVGRHNAVDKVIGAALLAGRLPAADCVLVVSGRASFELVQKAVMGGIPMLVAVGAPSSLAVHLATCRGMTLIGFARDSRFNIYAGGHRVRCLDTGAT